MKTAMHFDNISLSPC